MGRSLVVYSPASYPEFVRFDPDRFRHPAHFLLPDFSERFDSDFPPRSDLSERSPLSFSFSISKSAGSIRSPQSERSPPRSDRLSPLLPSSRVTSSVDEVVGWG